MDNRTVAHYWANNIKENGKGSNFYFEGPVLYSYGRHFIVGYRDDARGLWWLTNEGYSATTAKHISYARAAIPGREVLVSQEVLSLLSKGALSVAVLSQLGVDIQAEKEAFTATGRRKTAKWARELSALNARIQRFNDLFQADGFRVELIDETVAAEILKRNAAIERERKQRALTDAETAVKEWQAGERLRISVKATTGRDYLRLINDGQTVETSQGVKFSADDARFFWTLAGEIVQARETVAITETVPFGPYRLDRFDGGDIIAGCHRVPAEEAERLAGLLGLIDEKGAA